MTVFPRIIPFGDSGILIEYENEISPECNGMVMGLYRNLSRAALPEIVSIVPAYRSLLVKYDILATSYSEILAVMEPFLDADPCLDMEAELHEIPVLYGGNYGEDLENVARLTDMTSDDVIDIHCSVIYTVYMIGFLAGFPYLGRLPESLRLPRLSAPRALVPKGSVAIADAQTGIYPIDAPGGWHLIGRTPLSIFDLGRAEPDFIKPGHRIKFRPINLREFKDIENNE